MNTATVTASRNASAPAASRGTLRAAFARMLRVLRIELRHALELSGSPYVNGVLPPL